MWGRKTIFLNVGLCIFQQIPWTYQITLHLVWSLEKVLSKIKNIALWTCVHFVQWCVLPRCRCYCTICFFYQGVTKNEKPLPHTQHSSSCYTILVLANLQRHYHLKREYVICPLSRIQRQCTCKIVANKSDDWQCFCLSLMQPICHILI